MNTYQILHWLFGWDYVYLETNFSGYIHRIHRINGKNYVWHYEYLIEISSENHDRFQKIVLLT